MKKYNATFYTILFAVMIMFSSCNATMHTVGTGGPGDCKTAGQYDVTKKQWYLFWGLLPIGSVDSKEMANGAENYTVRTTTTLIDGLIAIPGSYLLGLKSQTIRVSIKK